MTVSLNQTRLARRRGSLNAKQRRCHAVMGDIVPHWGGVHEFRPKARYIESLIIPKQSLERWMDHPGELPYDHDGRTRQNTVRPA